MLAHNLDARPAQFDRTSQHRRAMIAKVNVARHQLAMAEDDYRQLLMDTTGQASLKACTDRQLEQMIDALKGKGFRPLPRAGAKPAAQHPMAKKARAMWISLYHLGVVRNQNEEALEAFAARQLGCEKLVWARQGDAYRLIEALKAMAKRAGWHQTDQTGKALDVRTLQSHLCQAILARLKAADAVPQDWDLDMAAWRLCGIDTADTETGYGPEHYARLAKALGDKLRTLAPQEPEA